MDWIIKTFAEWETIVFDNVESFEKDFCHGEELIGVYWSSSSMKVHFMMINGQHVTDGYSMDEWFTWLRKHCPHCTEGYVQDAGFVECNHCNKN